MRVASTKPACWPIVAILVFAAVTRLYHAGEPLLDQATGKQVHNANKARNIARTPSSFLNAELDFLNHDGTPRALAEEIPIYTGLLGALYSAFGEHEIFGRFLSIGFTLIAIVSLYDWLKRELGEPAALTACALFVLAPLLWFYGRAVMPDVAMLAAMLAATAAFRRHLDSGRFGWLAATWLAALLAGGFKYYGLIVFVPLAEMAARQGGWKSLARPKFVLLCAASIAPILLWIAVVFSRAQNPTSVYMWMADPDLLKPYFVFQQPGDLFSKRFLECLLIRFGVLDCGPVLAALVVVGAVFSIRRVHGEHARSPDHSRANSSRRGPLWGWAIAGLGLLVLTAPKVPGHDYYELTLLPAAAGFGAIGLQQLAARFAQARGPRARRTIPILVLLIAAVVHSPLVMPAKFRQDRGLGILAKRLEVMSTPNGRVAVMGAGHTFAAVHYSRRQGWVVVNATLPADWDRMLDAYKRMGCEVVGIYLNPRATKAERASYLRLADALPTLERKRGKWYWSGETSEYVILDLKNTPSEGFPIARRVQSEPSARN